jgi:hypothetical protein
MFESEFYRKLPEVTEDLNILVDGKEVGSETFEDKSDAIIFLHAFSKGLTGRGLGIYTQVDSDFGKRVYVKGLHYVNRTGVYAVVWEFG